MLFLFMSGNYEEDEPKDTIIVDLYDNYVKVTKRGKSRVYSFIEESNRLFNSDMRGKVVQGVLEALIWK